MRINFKWVIFVGVLVVWALVLFQPLFYREKYIQRLSEINLPPSYEIVDYQFGVNPFSGVDEFYGLDQFYAKVKIDQFTYDSWKVTYFKSDDSPLANIIQTQNARGYKSLNIGNVDEALYKQSMTSKTIAVLGGATGIIDSFITKEPNGDYYFYVLY